MKILALLAFLLISASAYESYWQKGDDLLAQLQNGKDELFVVTFYNPTPVKDDYSRQTENSRVQDELQSEVLNQYDAKPLTIRYSSIDSTDRANEKLLYKAGVKTEYLNEGPVILISRKGYGHIIWGPTVVHQTETFVKETQDTATEDQKSQ
mmetsp:Transcript_15431/g.13471  ORF Transcript_15431/g.13471 Transcript_15431/m.13471 type:complete len:152 (-) Transcript_15431:48-503(-)